MIVKVVVPMEKKNRQVTSRMVHGELIMTLFSDQGIEAKVTVSFDDNRATFAGMVTMRWVELGHVWKGESCPSLPVVSI